MKGDEAEKEQDKRIEKLEKIATLRSVELAKWLGTASIGAGVIVILAILFLIGKWGGII